MRNAIIGGIGTLLGGLIVLNWLAGGVEWGKGAYYTGQVIGLLLGFALFGVGLYYLIDGTNTLRAGPEPKRRKKRERPRPRPEEEPES